MSKSLDIGEIRALVQELNSTAVELEKIGKNHELPMLVVEAERLQEIVTILDLQIPRQEAADARSSPDSNRE